MAIEIDTKYRHELFSAEALAYMKKHCSLPHILLGNLILSMGTIILFLVVGLIPMLPHPTYGFGTSPSSVSEYLTSTKKVYIFILGLFTCIIVLSSLIQYIRTKIDIQYGYKNVGNFIVTKSFNRGSIKSVKLNSGYRLKIKDTDTNFYKIEVGKILEVEKTATYKFISCKILVE